MARLRTPSQLSSISHISGTGPRHWLRPLARAWAVFQGENRSSAMPSVEEYEPRLLYSVDLAPSGLALATGAQVVEQRVIDAQGDFVSTPTEHSAQRVELLIVDAKVSDRDVLLNQLSSVDGRRIEVLTLNSSADGIAQISAALAGRSDIAALHILSHGASGELRLGGAVLDETQLATRSAEIAQWGDALTDSADILLYGCDVAAGARGEAFVQQLSVLTHADVAASSDLTGNVKLGADWNLEYVAGHIESGLAFTAAAQGQWLGTLIETRANTTTSGTQTAAAVAVNATTGSFVVVWTGSDSNRTGVFGRLYDASGSSLTAEFQINTTTANDQQQAVVGMASDGSFVVAWTSNVQSPDSNGNGVFAQRFDALGAKQGGEILVNQTVLGNQAHPAIAVAADGQFVVAWDGPASGSDNVQVRHFSSAGIALSSELNVATNNSGSQFGPAVAIDSSGNYVVAWSSVTGGIGRAVFAQLFSSADAKVGSEFRVNTTDGRDQDTPTVAMAAGQMVVAWQSDKQDGDKSGIYAQRYNYTAAGVTPAGAEFKVNTAIVRDQTDPSAAMDVSGNFIITWTSDRQDSGNTKGVYAQRYFSTGVTNGAEFLVNSTTANDQGAPAAALTATQTIIAWNGNGPGDANGIFFQTYATGNSAPVAIADAGATNQNTTLTAAGAGVLANDTDPDVGNTLSVISILHGVGVATVVPAGAGGATIAGTYGDLLIRADGSYSYVPNAAARALSVGATDTDVFTYTVTDNFNGQSSSTLTITLTGLNDTPIARNDVYVVPILNTLIASSAAGLRANDTDVDASPARDTLVITLITSPIIPKGTFNLFSNGSFNYTAFFLGTDVYTYLVADGKGGTSVATVTFNNVLLNAAPVANNDSYSVTEDGVLTIAAPGGVLNNDTDANGNLLSAVLPTNPSHGTLVFNADGSFIYTPDADYNGADSFTYFAFDGGLLSGGGATPTTVNLTVTAVNDPPEAVDDAISATQNTTVNVAAGAGVLVNDIDIDGDTLSVTGVADFFSNAAVSAGTPGTIATPYGTLTLNANGSYSYVADGAASAALALGQSSIDRFSYTMSDGQGGTSNAILEITIAGTNDAPMNGVPGAQTVDEDTLLAISGISVNDADGDLASTQLTVSNGTLNVSLAGGATIAFGANGSSDLTLVGSQAQINAALATLSYQGVLNFNGIDTLRILSSDGVLSNTDTLGITVNAVNDAPAITSNGGGAGAAISVVENATAVTTVTANDADLPAQPLTFSIVAGSDSGKFSINSSTGALTFIAPPNFEVPSDSDSDNIYNVTVQASDGTLNDMQTIAVTVTNANESPAISVPGAQVVNQSAALAISGVSVNDVDGNLVTTELSVMNGTINVGLAGGATISAGSNGGASLTLTGTQAQINTALATLGYQAAVGFFGADTLTVLAQDSASTPLSAMATVSISVLPPSPPVNSLPAAQAAAEDTAVTLSGISVNDADGNLASVQLSIANGRVSVSLAGGATISSGANGTAVLTLTGTQLQINAALSTLTYQGNPDFNGTDTLTVVSTDSTGTPLNDTDTMTIAVSPVNDLPTAAVQNITTIDNVPYTFHLSDFGYSDVDGDALAKIRITALPASGALVLSSNGVAVNQQILAADIAAGKLQFVPHQGNPAPVSTAFAFQVNDGTTYSAARYNVSVFVQPSLIPGPDITGGPVVTPPSDPPVIPGVPPAAPVAPTATGNNPNAIGDKGLAPVPATEQTEVRVALIDAGASPQGSVRTDGIVDVRQTRNTTSGLIHLLGAVPITLERGTTQIGLEAFSSTDALIAGRITSATNSATFTQELDRLREDTKAEVELERNIVVSSVTAGAGMSVGYVFWLLRGGLLMTSLLSSLPAWRFVDPLPILGRLKDDGDEDDNESLESIVGGEDSESGQVGDERNA